MLKFLLKPRFLIITLLISSLAFAQIKTQDIEYYGYYVAVGDTAYQAKPSKLKYHFDLSKLGGLTSTPNNTSGSPYKVLVKQEKWSLKDSSFFIYNIDYGIHKFRDDVTPNVKKLESGMYELSFENIKDGQVLFVSDATGLYSIGLGNLEGHVENLFQNTNESASLVADRIKLSLKSFPENKKLKGLLKKWESKRLANKDIEVWKVVEEKYAKYKSEKDIDSKDFFARDTLKEIKHYLSLSDSPKYKSQALKTQKDIESAQEKLISKIKNTKIVIPNQSELKDEVRYFTDGNNLKISIVDIGTEGDALIRFSGLDNEHNNAVYRYKKAVQNSKTGAYIYKTREMNGKNWNGFMLENSGWYGNRASVFPPGINKKANVASDKPNTEDTALKIYRDYSARVEKHNQSIK